MTQPYIGLTTEDEPIYFVDDISEYDQSDIDTSSSIITDSTMSTLESTEARSYFREVYGRMFPADTNLPVLLPTDNAEITRLELQHLSIKLRLDGNYWGPVREVLAPDTVTHRRKRVLDMVTLEGTWKGAGNVPRVSRCRLCQLGFVPAGAAQTVSECGV